MRSRSQNVNVLQNQYIRPKKQHPPPKSDIHCQKATSTAKKQHPPPKSNMHPQKATCTAEKPNPTPKSNMLSRKEMTVAFTELLRRLDDIRIKDGAELKVSPNLLLRGFVSVPITFKKAAAA